MEKLWERIKNLHWQIKITLALFALIIIFIVGGVIPSIIPVQDSSTQGHTLEYVVTGSVKKAAVTYTNEKGWTYKQDIDIPWKWSAPSYAQDRTWFYISADSYEPEGWIQVEIFQDGKLFKKAKQFGPYITASTMGYAGDK